MPIRISPSSTTEVSNTTAIIVVGAVVGALVIYGTCKLAWANNKKSNFTRTCLTADGNCQFVRSHVDYVYKDQTEIPQKIGMDFPHHMGDPKDKLQPLDQGRINLARDEVKLANPDLLWKQYEHDWKGCGNGKPYIVNDEKTRFSLAEVGDIWAVRQLNAQTTPQHGLFKPKYPALTEQDYIVPEPFDRLYGGSWLHNQIGD